MLNFLKYVGFAFSLVMKMVATISGVVSGVVAILIVPLAILHYVLGFGIFAPNHGMDIFQGFILCLIIFACACGLFMTSEELEHWSMK